MGNWGCYAYDEGTWTRYDGPDEVRDLEGHGLRFFLADSDLAEVRHAPSGPDGHVAAFVGYTPRSYFDNPDAPGCTDASPAASALATWAGGSVTAADLVPLLATDGQGRLDDLVEQTLDRLVTALGLPPVEW